MFGYKLVKKTDYDALYKARCAEYHRAQRLSDRRIAITDIEMARIKLISRGLRPVKLVLSIQCYADFHTIPEVPGNLYVDLIDDRKIEMLRDIQIIEDPNIEGWVMMGERE